MKVAVLLLLFLGPFVASLLFFALTFESEDANIGGGMLILLAVPLGLALGVRYSKRHFE